MVKNPPAMEKTQVRSQDWEDPLVEKETATHSSVLACEMPWTEEPGGLWFMGLQRVRHRFMGLQRVRHNLATEPGHAFCHSLRHCLALGSQKVTALTWVSCLESISVSTTFSSCFRMRLDLRARVRGAVV